VVVLFVPGVCSLLWLPPAAPHARCVAHAQHAPNIALLHRSEAGGSCQAYFHSREAALSRPGSGSDLAGLARGIESAPSMPHAASKRTHAKQVQCGSHMQPLHVILFATCAGCPAACTSAPH
jgi:hypothetical protein